MTTLFAHGCDVLAVERADPSGEPLARAADAIAAPPSTSPSDVAVRWGLRSLASQYDDGQHKTYLDLLEKAVKDPKNRNIALSGPYGTGKSSVLDEFYRRHKRSTLRVAVSTG